MTEAGQAAEVFPTQLFQQWNGLRPLQGQQHATVLDVGHRQASRLHAFTDPGGVAVGAGCIDHHHHGTALGIDGAAVVDNQVIADAAGLVQQHRVARLTGANAVQIAGHQLLQR